jgi:CcmD family protein
MIQLRSFALPTALALTVALCLTTGVGAQEVAGLPRSTGLAQQGLRPYWHVFAAYAIVIVLVGGWAVSIARRLRDVERRLVD